MTSSQNGGHFEIFFYKEYVCVSNFKLNLAWFRFLYIKKRVRNRVKILVFFSLEVFNRINSGTARSSLSWVALFKREELGNDKPLKSEILHTLTPVFH